jgi:hypothetical protein
MKATNGEILIKKILDKLRPLLKDDEGNVVYSFPTTAVPMHLVISRGNGDPYHQDKQTGKKVFEKSYEKDTIGHKASNGESYTLPSYGLRVLIDLGSFDEGHTSREFKIAVQGRDGYVEKLVTTKRIIAMNAGAAGSGSRSPYFHARFGNGITIQVDLSLDFLGSRGKIGAITGSGGLNLATARM